MVNTSSFKTKTISIERKNEGVKDSWIIALDIGYSAIKGFSPNSAYCIPSYASKINAPLLALGKAGVHDMMYRDNQTGEIWNVGSSAQESVSIADSKDSVTALYGRNRYFSPMFLVLARVGLGVGMIENRFGSPNGKNLVVQTGLPPAYMKTDTPIIKEALSGPHDFDLKIGDNAWQNFTFYLPEENVKVMAQPMGTLLSISTDQYGKQIPEAAKYFKSHMLIFDPGFGTFDTFDIHNRMIDSYETFDDLGMKRVLQETSSEIFKKYDTEIPVPAMQKYLQSGEFIKTNRKEMTTAKISFADILDSASTKVCMEALERTKSIYNNLFDHNYLVVTGGTGAAWYEKIKEHFAGMETLKIIPGNQNDTLPYIFSNVRGYYMYQLGKLRQAEKKNNIAM